MSRAKQRKRSKKRRGGRTNPGKIAAAVICAVAACALIVCVAVFSADHIMGNRDGGQTAEETRMEDMQDIREEASVQEQKLSVQSSDNSFPAGGQETIEASLPEAESVPEKNPETEEKSEKTGTTVSIMGDSISTFQGYIPAGYYDFFPGNGLVSDVDDTWWKRVLDEMGWTLCVNGSSSGATCVGDSTGMDNPQCGCNEFRTGGLGGTDGTAPDSIIVYMGTNDFLQSIPLGDNDGTKPVSEGQVATFGDAYTLMLNKLQTKYPSSKIYCCTITQIGTYGTSTPYVEMVNGEGLTAADYSARIAQIAGNKNLPVIDLQACGITVENLHNTSADGVHPTPEGMAYIAEAVRKVLD